MTEFIVMRHARTRWNDQKRIQGTTDIGLSRHGQEQARQWGIVLCDAALDYILTSPMTRAVQTSALISDAMEPAVAVEVLDDLREQDFGDWEGRRFSDLRSSEPGAVEAREAMGWEFTPPGGESWMSVRARAVRSLETAARRLPEKRVLVITHTSLLKCLIYHLLGGDFKDRTMPGLKQGYCHEVLWEPGTGLSLGRVNAWNMGIRRKQA